MSEKRVRRAVILAAGLSRRLDSLALDRPKPLIEVAGKPLLVHHLEKCAGHGVEEVFINLHHKPEQIRETLGDGSKWKVKIEYHVEPHLRGTGGGVRNFHERLQHEPFLVLYGDNYCTFALEEIVEAHTTSRLHPEMSMMLFELEDVSASGVAVCGEDGLITEFVEKPEPGTEPSHWVNAGVYLLEPHLLNRIPETPSDFGRDLIPEWLLEGKKILGVKTQGRVYAVDTPELLAKLPRELAAK